MIAAIVAPVGIRNIAMMRACLVSGLAADLDGAGADRLRAAGLAVFRAPASLIRPICSLAEVVYLEPAQKLAHKTIIERFVTVVRSKNASPTRSDVRTALLDFDREGLRGLVQDLYTASKDNQAFLHARLGLGHDQLQPFKACISNWICPDVMKNQPISVSKAKRAIAERKWSRTGF